MTTKIYFLAISILIIIFLSGCSSLEVLSKWQESDLIIDGSKQDWENNLKYIKDEKVAVGITNDEQNLYLCLVVSEKSRIINLLRSGLTIWFEPQSSGLEKFGIQYPIKNNNTFVRDFSKKSKKDNIGDRQEKIFNKFLLEQNEFLVLNEDEYPLYASPLTAENGIKVKIGFKFNQLVYELKIPFFNKTESLLKVNTGSHKEIRIGFVSGKMERAERGFRQGIDQKSGGRSGGQKGMGGGRRGGMSGGQKGQRVKVQLEGIDFWINTVIVSNN